MILEKFHSVIIDFIDNAHKIKNLVGVILFGSLVKGDFHKKSDIDMLLLFDTDGNPEVGEELSSAQRVASEIAIKYDLDNSFAFVCANINNMQEIDTDFLYEVARTGFLIWGKPQFMFFKELKEMLSPMTLVNYTTKGLNERDKTIVYRFLYGYRVKKKVNGKEYINQKDGIVDLFGEKLGKGVFLIRAEKLEEILNIFNQYKVLYKYRKVWI
ncbi:MAG: nucleotidyltransferase family protein [Methanosarcinales archaeon]